MRRPAPARRSHRRLTARGLLGTVVVFGAVLAALSAPLATTAALLGGVAALRAVRLLVRVRGRRSDDRRRVQVRVPLTALTVRL